MPRPPNRILRTIPLLILVAGCTGNRQELADLAGQHLQQQAAHNEALLEQTEHLTGAAQELVEADAQARRELIRAQERLQTQLSSERQNLDCQRGDLESERRELAQQRHREPMLAAAIMQGALVLLAALPLVICALLFRALREEPPDTAVGELLIQELVAEQPLLLPAPAPSHLALEHRPDDDSDHPESAPADKDQSSA